MGDPTDRTWLEERTRRLAAGETEEQLRENPPAGPPNNGAWIPNVIPRWEFPPNQAPPQNVATQGLP